MSKFRTSDKNDGRRGMNRRTYLGATVGAAAGLSGLFSTTAGASTWYDSYAANYDTVVDA